MICNGVRVESVDGEERKVPSVGKEGRGREGKREYTIIT